MRVGWTSLVVGVVAGLTIGLFARNISVNSAPPAPMTPPAVLAPPAEPPTPPIAPATRSGVQPRVRIEDCNGRRYGFDRETAEGSPQVWLVGVYETEKRERGQHPMGEATVTVYDPGTHTVVLTSYEAVTWTVEAAEGVQIDEILLSGYGDQRAIVPPGTRIRRLNAEATHAYQWPSEKAETLLPAIEADLGRPVTHFAGCYRASEFHLADTSY